MVGSHHRLNGHKVDQTPGDSEGQGSLVLQFMGLKESDTTERLNNNSDCEHTFKTVERMQQTGETIIIIRRIIPYVWSVLWNHGP